MTQMTFVLMPPPGSPALPGDLDGAVAELALRPDGASVSVEVRIAGKTVTAPGGIDLGQVAYEGYLVSCDYTSVRGEPLPSWAEARPEIREHWRAAADGVAMWLDLQSRKVQ